MREGRYSRDGDDAAVARSRQACRLRLSSFRHTTYYCLFTNRLNRCYAYSKGHAAPKSEIHAIYSQHTTLLCRMARYSGSPPRLRTSAAAQ